MESRQAQSPPSVSIDGVRYVAQLSLEQDELLAPIVHEMLTQCPEVMSATDGMAKVLDASLGGENARSVIVSMAMDMVRVNAWLFAKKYVRRIMAIVLVKEGEQFEEKDLPAKEALFAKNATREHAVEVVNYFFGRSGAFGINMPRSSVTPIPTNTTP